MLVAVGEVYVVWSSGNVTYISALWRRGSDGSGRGGPLGRHHFCHELCDAGCLFAHLGQAVRPVRAQNHVPAGRHLAGRHQFRHGHGPACVSPGDTASVAGSLERVPGDCHSAGVIRIPDPPGWLGAGCLLHRADQRHPHRAVAGRLAGGDGGIPEHLFCDTGTLILW